MVLTDPYSIWVLRENRVELESGVANDGLHVTSIDSPSLELTFQIPHYSFESSVQRSGVEDQQSGYQRNLESIRETHLEDQAILRRQRIENRAQRLLDPIGSVRILHRVYDPPPVGPRCGDLLEVFFVDKVSSGATGKLSVHSLQLVARKGDAVIRAENFDSLVEGEIVAGHQSIEQNRHWSEAASHG